ncbi:MAG: hypothetical protein NT062_32060, partial [Proteobacteria bacterium]|nr:hypothetical protein [Pseudomonadota bacterium]
MKQVVLAVGSVLAVSSIASADPLRLRADALASTTSPVGLLSLEADAATSPLSAEAVVWMGDGGGDVLVIALHGKAMGDRVRGTVGRFVSMLGAMRPVHVDGASARVRLPHRFDVEVVAGIPVVPQLGGRTWDWLAGGRVARRLGDWGAVGVAVLEQREAGRLATEEVG